MADLKALAAHLEICNSTACSFNSVLDLHLVVTTQFVDLDRENAVAISYTWGEFSRQRRPIGHRPDGSPVDMELGAEWEDPDFVSTLHRICEETSKPCWIDQISIVQTKDEEIRAALARIPDIYRTFDVVALLPGAMCECRTSGWSDRQKLDPQSSMCWNNLGFSTYFSRLWPRQELLYARRLRVEWASPELADCPGKLLFDDNQEPYSRWRMIRRLSSLTRLQAQRIFQEHRVAAERSVAAVPDAAGHNAGTPELPNEAWDSIFSRSTAQVNADSIAALRNAKLSLYQWLNMHFFEEPSRTVNSFVALFLRGESLTEETVELVVTEQERLSRFKALLSWLGTGPRSTTHGRDLVLAVWPDCPRYVVPLDYKTMSLPALLEDAVIQLEQNWRISLITTTPSGLFRTSQDTQTALLWRPTSSIRSARTTKQVYQALYTGFHVYRIPHDHLSIQPSITNSQGPSSSRGLVDFGSLHSTQPGLATFELLETVFLKWPDELLGTILISGLGTAATRSLSDSEQNDLHLFFDALGNGPLADDPEFKEAHKEAQHPEVKEARDRKRTRSLKGVEAWDLHRMAYLLICAVMGIDTELARQSELRLVADLGEPYPRLGLFRVGVENLRASRTFTVTGAGLIGDDAERTDAPIQVEVAIQGSEGSSTVLPDYQVVGVWAPTQESLDQIIQGFAPTLDLRMSSPNS